jgi:dihydroorotate dehydrogenase electron transfer subunit
MGQGEAATGGDPGALPKPECYRTQAIVAESRPLPGDHHRLLLRAPQIANAARPGQFINVWCHPPSEIDQPPCTALLRRPYSIARTHPADLVEILLRVRGAGGRLLAGTTAGQSLDIIGPLGRGFRVGAALRSAVLVAGGIGLAPMPFLVESLVARGVRAILLVGATDDTGVPFAVERLRPGHATLPELGALGAEVTFVSESVDGMLVSELLEAHLAEFSALGAEVFATGPRAMLKRLAELVDGRLPLQVSLEERITCGVGACRSCVVPARGSAGPVYRTVCRDGPVFCASEIDWERLEP